MATYRVGRLHQTQDLIKLVRSYPANRKGQEQLLQELDRQRQVLELAEVEAPAEPTLRWTYGDG